MMPALFIGHGSPMNALEHNEFSSKWQEVARRIPRPDAILCISAHWVTRGTAVTAMTRPQTIHDFYGFPAELNAMEYPAPGSPKIAKLVQKTIPSAEVRLDESWGLDHGTWSVLAHMYPKADIPVLQLSIDEELSNEQRFAIGEQLHELREQNILILGLGNVVHNLGMMQPGAAAPPRWAKEFESFVKRNIEEQHYDALIAYEQHPAAILAQPTNEHYLPLLFVLGAAKGERPEFFNEKAAHGTISMLCVAFGLPQI